jgi:uncharacterized MAPEG superfamily protein
MKTRTIKDLKKHDHWDNPTKHLPENWEGTAIDILNITNCPAKDRIWMVTRRKLFFTDRQLRLFACDCAERALSRAENPDPRSVEAIKVARRYANGKATRKELIAAYKAACSAAATTEDVAAYWAACWVACSAAFNAAYWAGYSEERQWQIDRLKYYAREE